MIRSIHRAAPLLALALLATACNDNKLGASSSPDIAASPSSLVYTASAFANGATSATLTVILSNEGGGTLDIGNLEFDQATSTEFSWQFGGSVALPLRLSPGEWAALQVVYAPTDLVQDGGTLLVHSNDPDEQPLAIPITAEALGPQLACTPNPVTFVQAPGTPTTRSVTCANSGTQPITVTGFEFAPGTSGEFTSSFAPAPETLDPGEQMQPFTITYTPGELGTDAGQVLVHNDAGADYVIDLTGEGTDQPLCDLSAFPFFVDWGTVLLGQTVNKTVFLSNNGSGTCNVTSLQVAALTNEWTYAGSQTYTIQPGGTQPVTVAYKPIDRFPDFGALGIQSNDPAEPELGVILTGNGGGPEIDVLPCPVDFGLVTVGCKLDRQVTIYNTGDMALNVSGATLAAGTSEFSVLTAPSSSIPPNGSGTVSVRFAPTGTGPKSRLLQIMSNDGDEPVYQCQLVGTGTNNDHQTDTFNQATSAQADILFVIDNSGSMGDEQQTLSNSFSSFASYLTGQNASWQVGVTSTDIGFGGQQGRLVGNPKIITNATPNAGQAFAQNANLGTGGDATEQGLEAARLAITPPLVNGDNAGFVRAQAKLFLIFVSDEDDQSPDGNAGQSSQYFINAYRNVKGVNNPNLISASAIIGDVPNGCATAAAGTRYKEVVDDIGGVLHTICTDNFGPALQAIGVEATQPQSEFFLTRQAIANTIVVKVNNVTQPASAWFYTGASNSVTFNAGSVPAPGSTITIDYDVVCEMP